jgi:hypothetical protein
MISRSRNESRPCGLTSHRSHIKAGNLDLSIMASSPRSTPRPYGDLDDEPTTVDRLPWHVASEDSTGVRVIAPGSIPPRPAPRPVPRVVTVVTVQPPEPVPQPAPARSQAIVPRAEPRRSEALMPWPAAGPTPCSVEDLESLSLPAPLREDMLAQGARPEGEAQMRIAIIRVVRELDHVDDRPLDFLHRVHHEGPYWTIGSSSGSPASTRRAPLRRRNELEARAVVGEEDRARPVAVCSRRARDPRRRWRARCTSRAEVTGRRSPASRGCTSSIVIGVNVRAGPRAPLVLAGDDADVSAAFERHDSGCPPP